MQRRDFLKLTAAVGMASALPLWSRAVFAASRPALPIPSLLAADARNRIALRIQAGKTRFGALNATTWGYNGSLLGPALQLTQGKTVTVDITNQLAEETTLHWHGLEVPGEVDGGPQGVIAPGATRTVSFTPTQRAATCWFHPHQHGSTGRQVAMGLAGLVLIEDEESGRLLLPKQWGIDDVPVIVQDKKFTAAGEIDYQLDVMSAAVGWFGDTLLTNGALYPEHAAPRGWLRLRLLNGCNARSLNFATSDKRPLYVVASDGGLLAEPVKVDELPAAVSQQEDNAAINAHGAQGHHNGGNAEAPDQQAVNHPHQQAQQGCQRQQRHHRNTRIVGVKQGDDHPGQRQVGGHRQIDAFGEQHHHLPEGEDDKDGGIVKHLHQIAR